MFKAILTINSTRQYFNFTFLIFKRIMRYGMRKYRISSNFCSPTAVNRHTVKQNKNPNDFFLKFNQTLIRPMRYTGIIKYLANSYLP